MSYKKNTGSSFKTSNKSNNFNGSGSRRSSGGGGKVLAGIVGVIAVFVLVGVILGFIFSPTRGQCRRTIQNFQSACNTLNVQDLLNCMDPDNMVIQGLKIANIGVTTLTNQDTSDLLTQLLSFGTGGSSQITTETGMDLTTIFKMMVITPRRFGFPGRTRKVQCRVSISGIQTFMNIYLVKRDGEAYISRFEFTRR